MLVYIDETDVDNNLSKILGWAIKGLQSFTETLGFRTKRVNLIGGHYCGSKKLVAPMAYYGYTNSELFLRWVSYSCTKS